MNRISLFLALFLSITLPAFSQDTNCNCLDNLNKTIEKTEENYAGFPAKVNNQNKPKYIQLLTELKQQAISESNSKKCYYIIKNYIRFFEDKHFILSYSNDKDYDNEMVNYKDDYFKKGIALKNLKPIEGLWINPDSTLKMAIQKFPNNIYKGIIVESKDAKFSKGFVYLTLTSKGKDYVAKEYNSFITTDIPAKQKGNLLQIWNHALWGKVYPDKLNNDELAELNTWKNDNNGLAFKKLNPKTSYLKIPTFYNNDNKIQQLISKSDSVIRNTENLIIDLTGNGGGNTGWLSFLPYLITNPIVQEHTYLRVTPENVKSKLADLEPFVKNPIPNDYKKYFPEAVLAAYKKAYKELPVTKEKFYPIPAVTFPLDSAIKYPKKIALVFDNFCGSSTEYFFSLSKQSKKAIRYGTNTIGMMDYEGMSTPTPLPYNKFILTIPTVKSSWTDKNPIDRTGFKPQVSLNNLPQNKWLSFIMKDLENR